MPQDADGDPYRDDNSDEDGQDRQSLDLLSNAASQSDPFHGLKAALGGFCRPRSQRRPRSVPAEVTTTTTAAAAGSPGSPPGGGAEVTRGIRSLPPIPDAEVSEEPPEHTPEAPSSWHRRPPDFSSPTPAADGGPSDPGAGGTGAPADNIAWRNSVGDASGEGGTATPEAPRAAPARAGAGATAGRSAPSTTGGDADAIKAPRRSISGQRTGALVELALGGAVASVVAGRVLVRLLGSGSGAGERTWGTASAVGSVVAVWTRRIAFATAACLVVLASLSGRSIPVVPVKERKNGTVAPKSAASRSAARAVVGAKGYADEEETTYDERRGRLRIRISGGKVRRAAERLWAILLTLALAAMILHQLQPAQTVWAPLKEEAMFLIQEGPKWAESSWDILDRSTNRVLDLLGQWNGQ